MGLRIVCFTVLAILSLDNCSFQKKPSNSSTAEVILKDWIISLYRANDDRAKIPIVIKYFRVIDEGILRTSYTLFGFERKRYLTVVRSLRKMGDNFAYIVLTGELWDVTDPDPMKFRKILPRERPVRIRIEASGNVG